MAAFEIKGGNSLNGEICIQGSKNAALPILSACLLARGETKLYNCPHIKDVYNMLEILEAMGCHIEVGNDWVIIDSSPTLTGVISPEHAASMRSSVMLLGAVLGRQKEVNLPWPGGCSIGKRPVDIHLEALKKMNVSVETLNEGLVCKTQQLSGSRIVLTYPSVGATENVILAAVLARGTTILENAAKEPEIIDLCLFLNEMGAQIHGMGTGVITIYGVKKLHCVSYKIMSDRIVAGTYLTAAAATGGNVLVCGVCEENVRSTLNVLAMMGCGIIVKKNQIRVIAPQILLPIDSIHTQPFPGFPTDMQSQIMVCLTCAQGESVIYEDIFEDRFKIVPEIKKMGADVLINKNRAMIRGRQTLQGSDVKAMDLRGGAALVIAGLMAEGDTQVENSGYVERGYEDILRDLRCLGARIRRK